MKPIDQSTFGRDGNCMAACIASILELPLEDVQCRETNNWYKDVNLWLQREHRLALMTVSKLPYWFQGYLIVCGKSSRDLEHACVGQVIEGLTQVVHDPHPSREGILKITEIFALVKAD